jgi:hypothetical protein
MKEILQSIDKTIAALEERIESLPSSEAVQAKIESLEAELAQVTGERDRMLPVFKAATVLVRRWKETGHDEYLEMICDSSDEEDSDDSDLAELMLIEQVKKLEPTEPAP